MTFSSEAEISEWWEGVALPGEEGKGMRETRISCKALFASNTIEGSSRQLTQWESDKEAQRVAQNAAQSAAQNFECDIVSSFIQTSNLRFRPRVEPLNNEISGQRLTTKAVFVLQRNKNICCETKKKHFEVDNSFPQQKHNQHSTPSSGQRQLRSLNSKQEL